MTNEEKANEIAHYHCSSELNLLQAYNSALDMAEWKDEQFAEEKQQLIEKACEWLDKNASGYAQIISNTSQSTSIFGSVRYCGFATDKLIEDIKKAMEEL